ncbi:hypothetical protein [uncultured Sphingomonas sp.]|uniref:hypothetical protein n=1 Tax=uncultured Sphingomonas sp. TaxID=158754 RepID=UPI00258EEF45|nr:hypothetical protein [uncultured Sphingomonas sp.]
MSGTVVAAMVARARKQIEWHFVSAGATRKETAIAFERPTGRLERRVFDRMVSFGAIEKTPAGTFWLVEKRLGDFRKESLARVLGILAVAGFAAAGAMLIGG